MTDPAATLWVVLLILLSGSTISTGLAFMHREAVATRRVIWSVIDEFTEPPRPTGRVLSLVDTVDLRKLHNRN